jgi:peptidoglycan hydrolase FlgJ
MTTPVADASVYADLAGLAALKRDARAQDPSALRAVAKQFESIFAKMMLTSMRKASFGDPLLGSDQQDFYQGMFDDQLSMELTKGRGLGLADLLVQQLTRAGLAGRATDTAAEATKPGAPKLTTALSAPTAPAKVETTSAAIDFRAAGVRGELLRFEGTGLAEVPGLDALDATTAFIGRMQVATAPAAGTSAPSATTNAWRPASPEDFVRELWPCAEAAGKELGVDPRHLLAQAALETGWGKYLPCDTRGNTSFNLFGIKAGGDWAGNSVSVRTLEFEGGVPVPRQARFRAYDSAADSFRDYVAVLRDNPRYAAALNTGSDTKAFATALQRGGYATDPGYAQKIAAIAQNLAGSVIGLKSSGAPPINPEPLF